MKKFLTLSVAAAAMLGLASCSSDEPAVPVKDGSVRFNINLPAEVGTRAFADGTKAVALTYAVYEHGSNTPIIQSREEVRFEDLHATVELQLVNGKSYDFVWWAAVPNNPYYAFKATDQEIQIKYSNAVTNQEDRDAFFQHTTITNVQSGFVEDVVLRRPFAQINIGTNDLNEPAVKNAFGDDWSGLTTSLKVPTYTHLNLMTGEVYGDTSVTFAPAGIPAGETFPLSGYEYLSMDYVLVPADKTEVDMELYVHGAGAESIGLYNIPVQRNYRTNIVGSLLTSTGTFNIVIDPIFEQPDYNEIFR